jgi:hypothetical protein
MAKIWFCFEGDRQTLGEAKAERPVAECVDALKLTKEKYLGDNPKKVRFGKSGDPLASIRGGYRHVVVEIGKEEAAKAKGWKPGYYYSPLKPAEVLTVLKLKQA